MEEVLSFVRRKSVRPPWMAEVFDGGVIFNATSMDGGSAEFRRERNQCTAAPLPLLRDNNNSASA